MGIEKDRLEMDNDYFRKHWLGPMEEVNKRDDHFTMEYPCYYSMDHGRSDIFIRITDICSVFRNLYNMVHNIPSDRDEAKMLIRSETLCFIDDFIKMLNEIKDDSKVVFHNIVALEKDRKIEEINNNNIIKALENKFGI